MRFWHLTNPRAAFGHKWNMWISVTPPEKAGSMEVISLALGSGLPVLSGARAKVVLRSEKPVLPVIANGDGIVAKAEICEKIYNALPDSTQVLPIETESPFLAHYAALNIVGRYYCVDLSRSDVVWHPSGDRSLMAIRKLWLDMNKVPSGKAPFRIGEFLTMAIVNDDGRKLLESCGISPDYFSDLLTRDFNFAMTGQLQQGNDCRA